jgi:hypothetical protein
MDLIFPLGGSFPPLSPSPQAVLPHLHVAGEDMPRNFISLEQIKFARLKFRLTQSSASEFRL